MAEGARIGQPEIQLASMAPVAALRLPAIVGPRWAANLLLTGEQLQATAAAKIGLVSKTVPADRLNEEVVDLVAKLTQLSRVALRLNKRAYLMGSNRWATDLEAMEKLYLEDLMSTEDAIEGLAAFLEKRKPVWRDR